MKLTPDQRTAALATFAEYFVRNYPGPHTIISDPNWHAPKIFRAALHAIESESTLETASKPEPNFLFDTGADFCDRHETAFKIGERCPKCAQSDREA